MRGVGRDGVRDGVEGRRLVFSERVLQIRSRALRHDGDGGCHVIIRVRILRSVGFVRVVLGL